MQNTKIKNFIIFGTILISIFWAFSAKAAILYLEPKEGSYSKGDVFLVNLMIDTERERINAAQIELLFPQEKLEVLEISKGNSIFVFWPTEPSFLNESGKISLIGGVPGGFEGKGKIISIAFRVIFSENESTFAEINFSEENQVFLNDKLGTKTETKTQKAVFTLFSKPSEILKDEWKEEIEKDKIPPEPFEITLGKDPLIFNGKYFIAFESRDFQTGIDHYEVKEGKREWRLAKSPYLLEDQTLSSKILVKAVDKAGNERISELPPIFPKKPAYKTPQFWLTIIIFLFPIGFLFYFLSKKLKKRLDRVS